MTESARYDLFSFVFFSSSHGSPSSPSSMASAPTDYMAPGLRNGQWESGFLSYTESPEHFYVQLESTSSQLDALMVAVARHCARLGPAEGPGGRQGLGMPVLAQFSEDNKWYRAVVTGLCAALCSLENNTRNEHNVSSSILGRNLKQVNFRVELFKTGSQLLGKVWECFMILW